jgi:predicted ABC-type ATPase
MPPQMIVIAGPSGSGKSMHFPARDFGVAFFNVDDRCAELNSGSYHATPPEIRAQAQRECEQFIADCIANDTSFAVETTLRTPIAIVQAERACAAGFVAAMVFIATDDVHDNVLRIARRALDGGHSAPAQRIHEIYEHSLRNLASALAIFDELVLYDNSAYDQPPRLVRIYASQRVVFDEPPTPDWLQRALPAPP